MTLCGNFHQTLFRQLMTNYCEHVHNKFNKYTLGFFFCELLNVVICISQVNKDNSLDISNY